MSDFTKGDWIADDYGAVLSGEYIVCYTFTIGGNHDAHLIAAAPEMYAALEHIMNNQALGSPLSLSINNLLAKARGE